MLTLGDIKSSSVQNVSGVNPSDPSFTQYVNDAVRMLIELGHGGSRGWWGTVKEIEGFAYSGCFVWPADVIAVLGIRTFRGGLNISNQWYDYINPTGSCNDWARCWNGRPVIEFHGETCLFRPIIASPVQLQAVAESAQDTGKQIVIYGDDLNGNELLTVTGGVASRGITLTLGSTNVTNIAISRVTNVQKPSTIGRVRLYSYYGNAPVELLAIYNGSDINPKFQYSTLTANGSAACNCPMSVRALVKLGFRAMSINSDICPIDNVDAIKSMVQSIRAREAEEHDSADRHEKMAMRRLVAQVNSRFPLEQFSVAFKPFGRDELNHVTAGMI